MILASESLDPHWNLALEEGLLDHPPGDEPVLLLWRSANAVVVGKNQNPWRECLPEALEASGIAVARRVSGGGTVYQDEGNLNYAVFMPRERYSRCAVFRIVFDALRHLGFEPEHQGETSIAVDGLKVSGNAFCFRKGWALHHGTMLVQADLQRLRAAMAPSPWLFDTHAVASVPASVANLGALKPGLAIGDLATSLRARFVETCGGPAQPLDAAGHLPAGQAERAERFRSWEWRYGRTPRFSVRRDPSSPALVVDKGIVESIEGPSSPDARQLVGQRFVRELLALASPL